MSDPQPEPLITHADLLAGIKVMGNDLFHIRRELERLSQSSTAELIKIEAKHEKAIDALHKRIDPLKTRVDQAVILCVLATIVFPVLIGFAFRDNSQPVSTDQPSSLQRQ